MPVFAGMTADNIVASIDRLKVIWPPLDSSGAYSSVAPSSSRAPRRLQSHTRPAAQLVVVFVRSCRQAPVGRGSRLALRHIGEWRGISRRKVGSRKRVGLEENFAARFDGEAQAIGIDPRAAEHSFDDDGPEGLEQRLQVFRAHTR